MGQRSNYAAVKDAQTKSYGEESVGDTGQTALLTMYPLLLDQISKRLQQLSIYQIIASLMLHTTEVLGYLQK
eukprot:scaffold11934_cov80-Skeletonema_menzelii.AAC.2